MPIIRLVAHLLISSHCDDYTLFRAERSGAHGFVDKNTQSIKTLALAIRTLEQGKPWFSPVYEVARHARTNDPRSFAKVLSEREFSVLVLIGHSLSDDEIGLRLGISPSTCQTHRSHIMRKLGIGNSLKLVQFALAHGFSPLATQRNGRVVLP